MIEFNNTAVYGWEEAIRGMRNPMNSWDKSDSIFEYAYGAMHTFKLGENDLKLMTSLINAGSDHRKFLRMMTVTVDITAPLYWWKEFDTYKVGTVSNSCSTMHKIHDKELTEDDFSCEHLSIESLMEVWDGDGIIDSVSPASMMVDVIQMLNLCREKYLETKDKIWWWQMIQLLPSSYNQKRTVQLNYEVLRNIDRPGRRRDHKLDEWREFCRWAETLPYAKELIVDGD